MSLFQHANALFTAVVKTAIHTLSEIRYPLQARGTDLLAPDLGVPGLKSSLASYYLGRSHGARE